MKKELPDAPGVYFFLGANREILYIGKATSLKDRVRSYFSKDLFDTRGPLITKMVAEAADVDYRQTDSVLEALLLEASLIKQWRPPANSFGKDDKSNWYVVLTKENFPRVLLVRGHELYQRFEEREMKRVFGPFPHATELKEALRLIRRIFPFFDTKHPVDGKLSRTESGKIRFNQAIGKYPGRNGLTQKEYGRTIRHLILFFDGKKKELLRSIEREMKAAAKAERFEEATVLRQQMFALTHINDVSLIKAKSAQTHADVFRIEAYDVAHTAGSGMVGVMVVVEEGMAKKSDYRKFRIRTVKSRSDDTAALKEVLRRRLSHDEWPLPKLITVDGGKAQRSAAESVLAEFGYAIPIAAVVKDDRHRPRDILADAGIKHRHAPGVLLANAEAHRFALAYHKEKRRIPR